MPTEKQLLLKDLKHVIKHAKEKGDTELADKLQLKCDELEAKVKSEAGTETENGEGTSSPKTDNSDTGLELDETSVKFKNEGNEVTVLSRWKKLDPSDFLPQSGPLTFYNDDIMEKMNHKNLQKAVRQLSNINNLKLRRSSGYELSEKQVERVLSEENYTDEIMEMLFKQYGGFQYVWLCPGYISKKVRNMYNNNSVHGTTNYYPYTRNNDALIKNRRRSKLNKHLREIQSLKKNQSGGVELSTEKLDKIKREGELLEELADQHSGLYVI